MNGMEYEKLRFFACAALRSVYADLEYGLDITGRQATNCFGTAAP